MTASQSLLIYEVLNKYFKNTEDSKIVVEQIESIVEKKVDAKKDILLTKDDKIELINKMDTNFKWLVGILITMFGIVITLILKLINH